MNCTIKSIGIVKLSRNNPINIFFRHKTKLFIAKHISVLIISINKY
jgi:hypothetical protein